ncbi:MAG: hypothetical protein LAO23_03580 [Acidobacteriia bacterium]|nr:hypothetical protein [Terriglobia bacterium]
MNEGDAVVAKDEKQQWDAMCKVGKTKFLAGFFVRTFLVCLAGTVSVSAAHLARTKQWNGSDLALGILFAVIFSVGFTIIGGVGSWQDLERQFRKPDSDIR